MREKLKREEKRLTLRLRQARLFRAGSKVHSGSTLSKLRPLGRRVEGLTSLLGGKCVPKYHLRPETYGNLDELNAFLGMARAVTKDKIVKKILFTTQNHIFMIGADLALSGKDRGLLKGEISQNDVEWLKKLSADFKALLKLEPKFIIYGETYISSVLDVARAISRRAERMIAKMKSRGILANLKILDYLNCLSDVLYLLARYEEMKAGVKPKNPNYASRT